CGPRGTSRSRQVGRIYGWLQSSANEKTHHVSPVTHSRDILSRTQNAARSLDAELELWNFAFEPLAHAYRDLFDRGRLGNDVVIAYVDREHRAAMESRNPVRVPRVQGRPVFRARIALLRTSAIGDPVENRRQWRVKVN